MNLGKNSISRPVVAPVTINTSKNDVITTTVFADIVLNILDKLSGIQSLSDDTKQRVIYASTNILKGANV
jgi:hypothetical protein